MNKRNYYIKEKNRNLTDILFLSNTDYQMQNYLELIDCERKRKWSIDYKHLKI